MVFLTGEPEACVEISKGVLVFPCLPDILDYMGVHCHIPVHGLIAVDRHAVPFLDSRQTGWLHHLVGPLTPVAGAERRDRKAECKGVEAQGEHRAGLAAQFNHCPSC